MKSLKRPTILKEIISIGCDFCNVCPIWILIYILDYFIGMISINGHYISIGQIIKCTFFTQHIFNKASFYKSFLLSKKTQQAIFYYHIFHMHILMLKRLT